MVWIMKTQRQRHKDTDIETQIQRHRDRHRDIQADIETQTQRHRHRDIDTDIETQTYRHIHRDTDTVISGKCQYVINWHSNQPVKHFSLVLSPDQHSCWHNTEDAVSSRSQLVDRLDVFMVGVVHPWSSPVSEMGSIISSKIDY